MKIDSMRLVSVLTVLALICTGMVCMVVDDDSSAATNFTYTGSKTVKVGESFSVAVEGLDFDATLGQATDFKKSGFVDGVDYSYKAKPNNVNRTSTDVITFSGSVNTAGNYTMSVTLVHKYNSNVACENTHTLNLTVTSPNYTHTINYDSNGGSGSMSSSTVTDDNGGTSPVELKSNNFTKSGYHFTGWKIGSTIYQSGETVPVPGNSSVTAYAQWGEGIVPPVEDKITIVVDGDNVQIDKGKTVGDVTIPTKSGYTFNGWYSDAELNTPLSNDTVLTDGMQLYSKWTEDVIPPVEDKITIIVDGSNVQIDKGKTVGDVTIPTKSGYTFSGWYSDAGLSSALSNDTILTDGMHLYPKWTENVVPTYDHVITYKDGSSILKTQNVNNTVNGPVDVIISYVATKDGHTFKGWSVSNDSTSADYQNGDKVSVPVDGLILYAVWEKNVVNVTVDGVSKTFNEGSKVSDIVKPSRPGFEFKGWFSNEGLTDPVNDDTVLTNGMKLYSKMDEIVVPEDKVVVFIDGNNVLMDKGKKVSDIEKPSNESYTFDGWYSDDKFTMKVSEDTELKDKMILNSKLIAEITVDGVSKAFDKGTTVGDVEKPTKSGFTFDGWYSDEELTEEIAEDTILTNGMNLYAKFTEDANEKDVSGMILSIMAFVIGIILITAGYRNGFPVAMVIGLIIAVFGGISIGLENAGNDLFTWIKDLFGGKP